MSISSINPSGPSPLGAGVGSRNDVLGGQSSRLSPTQQRPKLALVPTSRPTGADAPSSAPAASVAPAGTDPQLWSILTSAERDHFAAVGARGPLTYGFAARTESMPAPRTARGGRLDVKA